MVPIGTLVKVKDINAPVLAGHYNMYPTAEITGNTAPGVGSGDAIQLMGTWPRSVLPRGMKIEWTELSCCNSWPATPPFTSSRSAC
jgi:multidrug efflux pump subunit AcrB